LFSTVNCNNAEDKIPYVYVDFSVDLNKPSYFELNSIGNSIYVVGGVSGIVIYRDGMTDFFAYDRACPYDPEIGRLVLDSTGFRMIDTVCGSEFSLSFDGAVLKGPAEMSMRKYNTYYNTNTNVLTVTN
jgi:hypothetical protein